MRLSEITNAVEPSLTRQLFNMAKQYNDVIDLTLGDPDIIPNEKIRKAASEAIVNGQTRYSANAGLIEVRNEVAALFSKEYGINVQGNENVIMTVGGMEGLYLAIASIVNPGDEIIIHAPYYVNYVQMIKMCGGVPVIIETSEENKFAFSIQDVVNAISEKTVAIVLNTPSNPTGQLLSSELLDDIARLAIEKDLYVISDEVYRTLIFEGKHDSVITREGMIERTIVVDSFSKRFAMTGYRIGYSVGPTEWIESMVKMQENVAACAPLPSQYAAIAAIKECSEDTSLCEIFKERTQIFASQINENEDGYIHCLPPVATFYLFINIEKTGLNSLDFAYKLLEEEHIAVAPGISYGKAYDKYVRVACTLDKEILSKAAVKINRFVKGITK